MDLSILGVGRKMHITERVNTLETMEVDTKVNGIIIKSTVMVSCNIAMAECMKVHSIMIKRLEKASSPG